METIKNQESEFEKSLQLLRVVEENNEFKELRKEFHAMCIKYAIVSLRLDRVKELNAPSVLVDMVRDLHDRRFKSLKKLDDELKELSHKIEQQND